MRSHVGVRPFAETTAALKARMPGRSSSKRRTPLGKASRNARASRPAPRITTCRHPWAHPSRTRSSRNRVRTVIHTTSASNRSRRASVATPGRGTSPPRRRTPRRADRRRGGRGGPTRRPGSSRRPTAVLLTAGSASSSATTRRLRTPRVLASGRRSTRRRTRRRSGRRQPAARNVWAIGAATRPPTPPPSTITANARSSRNPMNHAWVFGGVSVPNSAVPVLPAIV